jgi:hypothetical protein
MERSIISNIYVAATHTRDYYYYAMDQQHQLDTIEVHSHLTDPFKRFSIHHYLSGEGGNSVAGSKLSIFNPFSHTHNIYTHSHSHTLSQVSFDDIFGTSELPAALPECNAESEPEPEVPPLSFFHFDFHSHFDLVLTVLCCVRLRATTRRRG